MNLLVGRRNLPIFLLMVSVFSFVFSVSTQAAIYKWTDAQGKVHYSDQKVDEKASEQKVSFGSMPSAPVIALAQPKKYSANKPSRWLAVMKPELSVSESDAQTGKQFSFYFGGDCVSPTSLSYDAFKKRYARYLMDGTDMQQEIFRQLDLYNYRNFHFKTDGPMHDLDNNEGYILRVEILDFKVNACVRKLRTPEDSGLLDQFSISAFDKTNAWIKLRWTMINSTGDKTIATNISQGALNNIEGVDSPIAGMLKAAYKDSITNMMADPQFLEAMTPNQSIGAGAAATLGAAPKVEAKPEPASLSGLPGKMFGTSVTRANFAKALILVNPLRMSISNYYAERGEWPAYFSDIDVDSSTLREPGIVDSVEMRLGGVLHVKLSANAFGSGHYFQMVPDTKRGTTVDWKCKTTLDKSLWVGPCSGL